MRQYFDLISTISKLGFTKENRTGINTQSTFGTRMEFDISGNKVPLLTTKKVFHKGIIHELLWMLSGDTNIRYLKANGVSIWDSWIDPKTAEYEPLTFEERLRLCSDEQREKIIGAFSLDDQLTEGMVEDVDYVYYDNNQVVPNYETIGKDMMDAMNIKTTKLVAGELPNIYQHQWRMWDDTRIMDEPTTADAAAKLEELGYDTLLGYIDISSSKPRIVVQRKIDQITNVIERLKTHPDCRRLIVSAWNTAEIDEMALPPCHSLFQFWTRELDVDERYRLLTPEQRASDKGGEEETDTELCDRFDIPKRALQLQLYQRSADSGLGVPFNIVQYSLLAHMVAREVNMVAERFVWVGGDTHVYEGQEDALEEQMSRTLLEASARVVLNPDVTKVLDFTFDDIEIVDYRHHDPIKFPAAAV